MTGATGRRGLRTWGPLALAAALLGACANRLPVAGVPIPAAALGPAGAAASPVAPAAPAAPAPAGPAPAAASASGIDTKPRLAPPAAAAPPPPPAFATVIQGATRSEGLLNVWRKDERLWFELRPADFGRPFFLSPKLATGLGEPPAWGGQMVGIGADGGPQILEFRRQYNSVQLLARNPEAVAPPGSPEARALEAAFPPSLLGSALVASQPHPQSQAVLVDVTGIFVSDLLGVGALLQRAYRQSYALDARNSAVIGLHGSPTQLVIEVRNHYATAAIARPLPGAPATAPLPRTPRFVPDPRSLFVGLHYGLTALPEPAMPARRADARVGYFTSVVRDYGDELARDPRRRSIARWRLDKREPQAALSPPVKPIRFWLDRNIPERYRATVRDAVLAWNEAFRRIGFEDAIVVQQQPDDASFDTLDTEHASVRWLADAAASFNAIGPSHVDPRSGEILDADIAIQGLGLRGQRALGRLVLDAPAATWPGAAGVAGLQGQAAGPHAPGHPDGHPDGHPHGHGPDAACGIAAHAAEQLAYAGIVAAARAGGGAAAADDAAAERFVQQYLRWVVMHEVGHALGLRHNFRGSAAYDWRQLDDPRFVMAVGTSGSVMDYPAVQLPPNGQPVLAAYPQQLGPYDHWAIEYGYAPLAAAPGSAEELRSLQALAARGQQDRRLAFATDEDLRVGLDPDAMSFDLGDDAIAFAERRFAIAREVLQHQDLRPLPEDEDYASLRRAVGFALRDAGRAAAVATRQIGGLHTWRDHPGGPRDPLQPVPAARQRAALDLIVREVFAPGRLAVPAELRRRLAPDYLERSDAQWGDEAPVPTDFSVDQMLFDTQRGVLSSLMSDALAQRVLDNAAKLDRPQQAFTLDELYGRLGREIWRELEPGSAIAPARRELQREHLNQLAAALLRPGAMSRADARGLLREQARRLLQRLEAARRGPAARDALTRVHLNDAAESLRLALAAPLLRGSP